MKKSNAEREVLVEGLDYYIEHGFWVFTAHFLQKRGFCCGSGCRHCPYGKPDKGVDQAQKKEEK